MPSASTPVRGALYDSVELPQGLAARTDVGVGLAVVGEVGALEGPVLSRRLVEDGDVRLDAVLLDKPVEHRRRAVGAVGDQPLRVETEALHRSLHHGSRGADLGLADGAGRLDIDDDRVVGIDQVVRGIGEEGVALVAPVHCAAGSDREVNFGSTGLAAPKAASSSTARYSRTARGACAGSIAAESDSPRGVERCLFASAWIRLASTAKRSPPASPSAMQRRTVASNTWRSRSLSRKRPCRFFEKVEWSGTRSVRSRRQTTDTPG